MIDENTLIISETVFIIFLFVAIFAGYVFGLINGAMWLGKDYPVKQPPKRKGFKPIKSEHKDHRPKPTETPLKYPTHTGYRKNQYPWLNR